MGDPIFNKWNNWCDKHCESCKHGVPPEDYGNYADREPCKCCREMVEDDLRGALLAAQEHWEDMKFMRSRGE